MKVLLILQMIRSLFTSIPHETYQAGKQGHDFGGLQFSKNIVEHQFSSDELIARGNFTGNSA